MPAIVIHISDPEDFLKGRSDGVRNILKEVLRAERATGEFSFAYVDDRTISRLNRQYLRHRGPTDVIAFPLEEQAPAGADRLVGEIVVSGPVARRTARKLRLEEGEELVRYSIHGLLHLLGYEDSDDASRAVLKAREDHYVHLLAPLLSDK